MPRIDPPAVLPTRWNGARLVFFGTGSKVFTDTTIIAGLGTQLHITPTPPAGFVYRVQEARVWLEITPNNPLKAPLQCRFHSVFGENFLSIQADYGGEVRYARCGYSWPVSDQVATLSGSTVDLILEVLPTDTAQNWVLHLDVLWSLQLPGEAAEEYLVEDFENLAL